LELTNSLLEDIRAAVGLERTVSDFDTDLLMYINSAIGTLNQNGVGNDLLVTDDSVTWIDLQNPDQIAGNKYFKMVPLFVMLSTKILFDPPPPSNVLYHQNAIDQALWRLKIAYEEPITTTTTLR
jgi:hypothetical protein